MFSNIGSKIKTLAKVICWLGIIASVAGGAVVIATAYYATTEVVLLGIGIAVLGSLLSWIGSFFAYGFGQLIENTDAIRSNTQR